LKSNLAHCAQVITDAQSTAAINMMLVKIEAHVIDQRVVFTPRECAARYGDRRTDTKLKNTEKIKKTYFSSLLNGLEQYLEFGK